MLHRFFFVACAFGAPFPMNTRNSTRATFVSRIAARSRNAKLRMAPAVYAPMPLNDSSVASSDGSLSAVGRDRLSRDRLQPLRPDVVTERPPRLRDIAFGRIGERFERGILLEPLVVFRQHAIDLRLLQHDFRDEDVIRIGCLAPRQRRARSGRTSRAAGAGSGGATAAVERRRTHRSLGEGGFYVYWRP